jgi:hypothetical protein
MILTDVETITNDETILRLIDRKDWRPISKHDVPLTKIRYIDFCVVPLSPREAMAKLRREGYTHLGVIDGIVYVAIKSDPAYDDDICRHIAEDFFGVEARITHVHPASSQAGIASFNR